MIRKYLKDSSGQFALITAIFAVPLVICAGIAIDTAYLNKKSTGLQTALDSAALAAVIPGNLSDKEREDYAVEVFKTNYEESAEVELIVNATPARVDIQGTIEQKTIFLGIGDNTLKSQNKAAAIKTVEEVICLMTLDRTARGSLTIEKNAAINAPGCSIQVNSDDQNAFIAAGNYVPSAQKICVHGGVNGNVGPNTQAQCSYVEDPYANIEGPQFVGNEACQHGPISSIIFDLLFVRTLEEAEAVVGGTLSVGSPDKVLTPGVYCGGLHIYDSNVTFEPGTYIIHDGPLSIGHNSVVAGDGVTFVFTGEDSFLYTYDEVSIDLTAPSRGEYAGLIFAQDRDASAGETSIIKGSADIKLVGTSYFPTQDLFVGGLGHMGANSPAMAFIAENMTLTSDIDDVISENEANFQYFRSVIEMLAVMAREDGLTDYAVSAANTGSLEQDFTTTILTNISSHRSSGLPPVLPRSDGGARLISTDDTPLQK